MDMPVREHAKACIPAWYAERGYEVVKKLIGGLSLPGTKVLSALKSVNSVRLQRLPGGGWVSCGKRGRH